MKRLLIGKAKCAASNEIPSQKSFKVSIINLFGRWNNVHVQCVEMMNSPAWVTAWGCEVWCWALGPGPHAAAPPPLESCSLCQLLITPGVRAVISFSATAAQLCCGFCACSCHAGLSLEREVWGGGRPRSPRPALPRRCPEHIQWDHVWSQEL